MHENLSSATL
jgi:hypothetical protein